MLKTILFSLFFINFAYASQQLDSFFDKKKYKQIVEKFHKPEKMIHLTSKQLVKLSYSLRHFKMFREDSKVIYFIIKKDLASQHAEVRKKIRDKKTLNAEDYPLSLRIHYWQLYKNYADILLSYKKTDPQLNKDRDLFIIFRGILGELEFREGKVEKINDKVSSHIQALEDAVYHFTWSLSLQYVSWQHDANMYRTSSNKDSRLIITNSGYCLGGDIGIENGHYHFNLNGCFLLGSGGVSSYGDPQIVYQQNIAAQGIKIGPEASMIVSSSKSRIGIGLPLIFTSQKLTQPSDTDYKVEEKSPFAYIATINSRWQFGKWYLKAEFGQYFKKQESYWGLGIGKQF